MSMCCFQDRQAVPTAGDDLPGSGAEYELALNRLRLLGEQQPRACGLEVVQNLETRLVGGQGDQPEDVSTCKRSFGEREHHGGCGLLATRDQAAAFSLLADGLKLLDSSSWVGEPSAASPKLHP